jgi:hypothetical protein
VSASSDGATGRPDGVARHRRERRGKTTTIGKLAARETAAGRRVVLAAADTFRAAAAEQLGIWAERTGAQLVRGDEGADPASVAYAGASRRRSRPARTCSSSTRPAACRTAAS